MAAEPKVDGDSAVHAVRSGNEIARRSLALGAAVSVAFRVPVKDVRHWLTESGIEHALTPLERAFIYASKRSKKQYIEFSWKAEALLVLLWSIGKISELPGPDQQDDTVQIAAVLPPDADISVQDFLSSSVRRTTDEILDMERRLYDFHVIARQRKHCDPGYRPTVGPVDIEIAQERHYGINWVVGYEGQEWDEITTDT